MLRHLVPAVIAAAAVAGPALAQTAPVRIVRTHDLDLSRTADRTMLNRRIAAAVIGVCPSGGPASGMLLPGAVVRCRRLAAVSAHRQVLALAAAPQVVAALNPRSPTP